MGLSFLVVLLPYLSVLFNEDVAFAVASKDSYIKVQQGKDLTFKIREGDPIPEGGAAIVAVKTGNVIIKDVPKEVYGVPFKSYAIPIKEAEVVIGVLLMGKSQRLRNEVVSLSKNVSTSLNLMIVSINHIALNAQNIENANQELIVFSREASNSKRQTNEILKFLQSLSSKTNILGLNASIESARAGASGRPFDIIAEEIRKLSVSSATSINNIDSILKRIELSIQNIERILESSRYIFVEQNASIKAITLNLETLKDTGQKLEILSEEL